MIAVAAATARTIRFVLTRLFPPSLDVHSS
jgi:hypothetical protein